MTSINQENEVLTDTRAEEGWTLIHKLRSRVCTSAHQELQFCQQAYELGLQSGDSKLCLEALLQKSGEVDIEESAQLLEQAKQLANSTNNESNISYVNVYCATLDFRKGGKLEPLKLLKNTINDLQFDQDFYRRIFPKIILSLSFLQMGLHSQSKLMASNIIEDFKSNASSAKKLNYVKTKINEIICTADYMNLIEDYPFTPIPIDKPEALSLLKRFSELCSDYFQVQSFSSLYIASINFADLLISCSQFDLAEIEINKIINGVDVWQYSPDDRYGLLPTQAFLKMRRDRDAQAAAETFHHVLVSNTNLWPVERRDIWQRLIEAYVMLGDYQKAYEGFIKYHELQSQHARNTAQLEATLLSIELQTERQKLQQQQALIHAGKLVAVGQLASSIAHELSQPAGTLLLLSKQAQDLIQNQTDPIAAPKLQEVHGHIQLQADRLSQLVRRMNNFARKELISPRMLSLNAVIQQAQALYVPRIKDQKVKYYCEIPENNFIHGDPERLTLVLVNLIANALDAMRGQSQPEPEIRLQIQSADTEYLELHVIDNGPGMSEEAKRRLFEPFYTTKPAGQGLGLGLAIASEAMNEMQGQLSILSPSPQERGMTFVLSLSRVAHKP